MPIRETTLHGIRNSMDRREFVEVHLHWRSIMIWKLGPLEKYDMITGTLCSLQCPVSQKNEDHNPV